jgi:hypothetical protein
MKMTVFIAFINKYTSKFCLPFNLILINNFTFNFTPHLSLTFRTPEVHPHHLSYLKKLRVNDLYMFIVRISDFYTSFIYNLSLNQDIFMADVEI